MVMLDQRRRFFIFLGDSSQSRSLATEGLRWRFLRLSGEVGAAVEEEVTSVGVELFGAVEGDESCWLMGTSVPSYTSTTSFGAMALM
ncbi:hypothetical protein L915_11373 [Phytophthora nicotianae]|uniref:Uncharacterized protein n=3 Tax=Phytophthora nicotianae TaxID=4792 RepID=W2ITU6_PHYNI|nr:hypothetical protein L915_11373 [Phytophthora nicotianae]ETL36818.1 hypothetical protein L916_11277 [Phytophthora nicotianae]